MKLKIIICLSMFVVIACSNFKINDPLIESKMLELLKDKNYFKLREELKTVTNKLSQDRLLYYKTYSEYVFGNGKKSNEYADILLDKYINTLHDTIVVELLTIKSNNFIRNYQYEAAASVYQIILDRYENLLDSTEIADYNNELQLNKSLKSVGPQRIHQQNRVEIQAKRNRFNHLMIPVESNGIADEFIFDTGAGLSTISNSYANKMEFTIFESNIDVWSSTGVTIQSKLAVADSIYVGDIMFENVVFLVMPDEQLSFPSINYEIHGIIGFPVFHQMGEVHMYKDGTIKVPKKVQNRNLNNMYLDGLKPFVQVLSNSDTLLFTLDTGAKGSELYYGYYEQHKNKIEANGELKVTKRGGAGGIVDVEEYILYSFPYSIGSKSNILPQISVVMEKSTSNKKGSDGNLGQDVIMQFDKMILNFKYMYIDFD